MGKAETTDPNAPVVLRTLEDHWCFDIRGICKDCRHNRVLDKAVIAERYGGDILLSEIRRMLRCAACASRNCGISLHHDGRPGWARERDDTSHNKR